MVVCMVCTCLEKPFITIGLVFEMSLKLSLNLLTYPCFHYLMKWGKIGFASKASLV